MKYSTSTFRAIIAFPFGLIAEIFARLTAKISGNQLDLNFNQFNKE